MHTAFSAAINHIPGVLGHSNDAWLPAPTDHLPVSTINLANKHAAGPPRHTVEFLLPSTRIKGCTINPNFFFFAVSIHKSVKSHI